MLPFKGYIVDYVCQKNDFSSNYLINAASSLNDKNINMRTTHASTKCLTGNNRELNSIITELFIRGGKLNISLVFITQSYFKVPEDVRLNTSYFFIAKIPNKRKLQQIAINHSSDINTKDFANIYRKCTAEPYSFSVIDIK